MTIDEFHVYFHTQKKACMLYIPSWYPGRAFKSEAEGGQSPDFHFKMMKYPQMDGAQFNNQLWTAPDAAVEWDLDEIADWCLDPRRWRDPMQVTTRPAERVVTLSGGYVFCAVARSAGQRLRAELETLAAGWGLQVIAGAEQDAWVDGEV